MDNDLKEALKAIQTLRAALWIAYDGGGMEGMATHPVEVTKLLDDTGTLLKRHGEPDELLDGGDDEIV